MGWWDQVLRMSNRKRIWWKSFNKDLLTNVVWNGVLVLTSNVPEEKHHPDGLNPSKSQNQIFLPRHPMICPKSWWVSTRESKSLGRPRNNRLWWRYPTISWFAKIRPRICRPAGAFKHFLHSRCRWSVEVKHEIIPKFFSDAYCLSAVKYTYHFLFFNDINHHSGLIMAP